MIYKAKFEKDGDDLVLVLPEAVIATLGVKEGDMIKWSKDERGRIIISGYRPQNP